MEKFFNDLTPIYDEVRKIHGAGGIKTKEMRDRAAVLNGEWKRIVGEGEKTIKPHKDKINSFKETYILTPERKVNNRGEEIRGLLGSMMATWDRDEEAAAKAEEKRKQADEKARLDRIAEEQRQADEDHAKELRKKRVAEIRADLAAGKFGDKKSLKAKRTAQKLLQEAGATEEAALTKAAIEEQEGKEKATQVASTVKVAPVAAAPVAGNVRRKYYSAKCTDPRLFVVAMITLYMARDMAGSDRLMEMVQVSDSLLSDEAKRIKTHDGDDNPKHDLTAEQFVALYPFVALEEKRTY